MISGTLQSDVDSAFQVVKIAMIEYYLVKDPFCTELEFLHELEYSFAPH